ncbi:MULTISPECIES: hypothetical protein [unclassified Rhodococcus (in: high G+C Gram-positive bacteria)]|uniref:hypothetical protein n=1 Tax=unclassified Rhodococcus (in: high G+C Gram-positive bacteria) TaxID=192944 RepID=UPI0020C6AB79|nr:hypothetical protein [Rhodococcus sp. W8901]
MDGATRGDRLRRRIGPVPRCRVPLLDAGADPSIRDARGRTPLQKAQSRGQHDIVAVLTASNGN